MELYIRPVTVFDNDIVTEFNKEHHDLNEKIEAGDGSLILGKSYDEYDDFYDWFQAIEKLDREEKLKKNQVGCTTYLVLTKEEDKLIALLDIRHSLDYPHGEVYGHIGVDIRPRERNKGFYKEILKLALEAIKEYGINKVVIACEYSNIPSKRGIEHIFKKEYKTIPVEGTYYLVYEKELGKKE